MQKKHHVPNFIINAAYSFQLSNTALVQIARVMFPNLMHILEIRLDCIIFRHDSH